MYVCVYIYIYICTYICISVCIYIYTHMYIYISLSLYLSLSLFISLSIYIYIYPHVYMYMYMYTHIYIYIYIYIYTDVHILYTLYTYNSMTSLSWLLGTHVHACPRTSTAAPADCAAGRRIGRMDKQTFLSSMLTYKVSLQFQTCSLHEVLVVSLVVDVDSF